MSVQDISPELDKLEAHLNKLEAALEPVLDSISDSPSQLPLIDRAKLHTLTNYALATLLFSSLRLQGADALNHPVFTTELKRVKQYFAKIQAAENPPQPRTNMSVNTEAATRIIKANLSDDKALKNKLAEQVAKEKAKAFLKTLGKRQSDSEPSPVESPGDAAQGKGRNKRQKKSPK